MEKPRRNYDITLGVFDGHNGREVADIASETLSEIGKQIGTEHQDRLQSRKKSGGWLSRFGK